MVKVNNRTSQSKGNENSDTVGHTDTYTPLRVEMRKCAESVVHHLCVCGVLMYEQWEKGL
jgi:hypothetical protein